MMSAFVAAFLSFFPALRRCVRGLTNGFVGTAHSTAASQAPARPRWPTICRRTREVHRQSQLSSHDVLWGPTIWRRRCHRSAVGHGQEGAQLLQEWCFPWAGLPVHPGRQVVHRQPLFLALKGKLLFRAYVLLHPVWPTPQVPSGWLACGNANAGEHRAVVLRPAFEAHTRPHKDVHCME